MLNTLKINGIAKAATPPKSGLVIAHDEALKLLLASEASTDFPAFIREELPAIISHWLQSPKNPPILVEKSYGEKWIETLRLHCQLRDRNPASEPVRATKQPKPVYIDFLSSPKTLA